MFWRMFFRTLHQMWHFIVTCKKMIMKAMTVVENHCGLEPCGWSFDSKMVINLLPVPFTDPFWEIKFFSQSGSGCSLDNFLKVKKIWS